MESLSLVARFALASVFLIAGAAKVAHRADFRRAVQVYELLPSPLVPLAATWIPRAELFTACLLALGFWTSAVSAAAACALAAFT